MTTNWAGNHTFCAAAPHRPTTLEGVRELVAAAPRVRVLGQRHSFNDIADAAELISLEAMPAHVVVDRAAGTVTCAAGMTYARLADTLKAEGLALRNLASLPHISVAGAIATATHGSGNGNGNLATAVAALELVTSDGDVRTVRRGDHDFDGIVVGLGAMGAVTRVTLDVEPAYDVRQRVFERLPWDRLLDRFDDVTAAGDSVSLFTRWDGAVDQVWVKSRVGSGAEDAAADLLGATPAAADVHPLAGMDPVNCTPQMGSPGPWSDRLPHFRAGFVPSAGDELQAEYMVPRRHAPAAIEAVRSLGDRVRPVLRVSEIRTVAADRLWMSPQHGRDTVAIHFTWRPDQDAVARVLADVERALAPFRARPHWGKLFLARAGAIGELYERRADFARLVASVDARGAFRNRWLDAHVLGAP